MSATMKFIVEAETVEQAMPLLLNHVCEYYGVDVKPVASLIGLLKNNIKKEDAA